MRDRLGPGLAGGDHGPGPALGQPGAEVVGVERRVGDDAPGGEALAERARPALTATGASARRRVVATLDELTAQEAQIARLAGERLTNPEIGTQLFLSPRTVEWHLRKVFTKLGVSARRELVAALARTHA